jgi:hypothetical protein
MALASATAPISATAPASATAPVSATAAMAATAAASVGLYSNLRTPKSTIPITMPINNPTDAACSFVVVLYYYLSICTSVNNKNGIEMSCLLNKSNNRWDVLFKMISPKCSKLLVETKKVLNALLRNGCLERSFMKKRCSDLRSFVSIVCFSVHHLIFFSHYTVSTFFRDGSLATWHFQKKLLYVKSIY